MIRRSIASSFAVLLCACSSEQPAVAPPPPSPAAAKLVLATDPGAATGVVDAKLANSDDALVVEGRVARTVPGQAAFTLVDLELPYCGEKNREDNCKTPWDYCCETQKTLTTNAMNVEARGADGQPIATPALPELRLLDHVKVVGKLAKDDFGNFTLLATGWHRVARPNLPDDVKWPH